MAGKILFIVVDQMRGDCVRGAMAASLKLPNIARLMDEGVTFAQHYSVTSPCGPARASLLTGLYAMNHRSVRNGAPLRRDIPNIATEARKAGYEPLLFGYSDTSPDPTGRDPNDPDLKSYEGLMPGFAEVVQLRLDSSYSWVADLKAKGYDLPDDYWDIYRADASDGGSLATITGPALYRAEDSDTAFLTDHTLRALSVREDQNWFAHVTYIRPHPPLVAPAPYNAMYPVGGMPEPVGFGTLDSLRQSHPFFAAFFSTPAQHGLYIGFDGRMDRIGLAEAKALRAVYFGLASEVDTHIGRLLDYLDASGQADDTLVVFTADHGEVLGDHHMWGKDSVFDPAFHVPLVIRDPRRRGTAGTVVEAFTESIDVAPTILDWLGHRPPLGFNGRSLLPHLDGETPEDWRDHIFFELDLGDPIAPTRFQRHMALPAAACNLAVLREARFKLVHFNGGLPPLLYDMEAGEGTDLASDPAYAPELLRLSRKMLDHRMTHADHAFSLMKITDEGVATP